LSRQRNKEEEKEQQLEDDGAERVSVLVDVGEEQQQSAKIDKLFPELGLGRMDALVRAVLAWPERERGDDHNSFQTDEHQAYYCGSRCRYFPRNEHATSSIRKPSGVVAVRPGNAPGRLKVTTRITRTKSFKTSTKTYQDKKDTQQELTAATDDETINHNPAQSPLPFFKDAREPSRKLASRKTVKENLNQKANSSASLTPGKKAPVGRTSSSVDFDEGAGGGGPGAPPGGEKRKFSLVNVIGRTRVNKTSSPDPVTDNSTSSSSSGGGSRSTNGGNAPRSFLFDVASTRRKLRQDKTDGSLGRGGVDGGVLNLIDVSANNKRRRKSNKLGHAAAPAIRTFFHVGKSRLKSSSNKGPASGSVGTENAKKMTSSGAELLWPDAL
jgi:hypothetical protein